MTGPAPASSRDTRLLITTLVVSAVMLMVLARFRFPDRAPLQETVSPAPAAPLERLAARATYGELARVLGGVSRQIAPGLAAFRASAVSPGLPGTRPIEVPAIRLGSERAVAFIGAGRSIERLGTSDVEGVLAVDAARGIILVKVVPGTATPLNKSVAEADLAAPGYAAAIEMTSHGIAVRPFFYGRIDTLPADGVWGRPAWRFSGLIDTPAAGAAIYLLDGRFVGLGFPDGRGFVVIPGAALKDAAERMAASGSIIPVDLGIEVTGLNTELMSALTVDHGVAVTHVFDEGPARGQLHAGDVLQRIDTLEIRSEEDYRAALGAVRAGTAVAVEGRRRGEGLNVSIVPSQRDRAASPAARELGLQLRALRGVGAEVVRVEARSAAAIAGIAPGDVITVVDRTAVPTPGAIEQAFAQAAPGSRLLVAVERGDRHLLLVLAKP